MDWHDLKMPGRFISSQPKEGNTQPSGWASSNAIDGWNATIEAQLTYLTAIGAWKLASYY